MSRKRLWLVEEANARSLMQLTNAITDDRHAWQDQGVSLVQWGPDFMNNQVVVHLSRYSDEAADALYDKYGRSDLLVSLEDMEPPVQFSGRLPENSRRSKTRL